MYKVDKYIAALVLNAFEYNMAAHAEDDYSQRKYFFAKKQSKVLKAYAILSRLSYADTNWRYIVTEQNYLPIIYFNYIGKELGHQVQASFHMPRVYLSKTSNRTHWVGCKDPRHGEGDITKNKYRQKLIHDLESLKDYFV